MCVCVPTCVCACTYTLLGHSSLVAVTSKLQHCLLKSNDYNLSRALVDEFHTDYLIWPSQ